MKKKWMCKILRYMRNLFLLLLISASSIWARDGYSQKSQEIFSVKSGTIESIFRQIKKQSGYEFFYNTAVLDVKENVSLATPNGTLEDILSQVLGNKYSYSIRDNYILISGKKHVLPDEVKKIVIKGLVKDRKGESLPGVSVLLKGTTVGVATDVKGEFMLTIPAQDTIVLRFTFIGMKTKDVVYRAQEKPIVVVLEESATEVEEVIVTGYQEIKKERMTGSVEVVTSKDIANKGYTSVEDVLKGQMAGVAVMNLSGRPGAQARIRIRGINSLTGDTNPIWIVDGMPLTGNVPEVSMGGTEFEETVLTSGIGNIPPDDIESINMLTGPSAAALYGNAAANGVVLINTKKGSAEKTTLTVSNNTMFSDAYMMPEMQNRYGNNPGEFASWGNKTKQSYDPSRFFNTGVNVINAISFSTGTKKNQTYASASTTNATGILPNNSYSRYNFSIRNTATFLKDRLTLDVGASYIIQNDKNITAQGQYFNPLPALYLFPRNDNFEEIRMFERYSESRGVNVQFWPYGHQGLSLQNPYWIMKRMNRKTEKKRYMINASLTYKLTDWLNVAGRVKVDNSDIRMTQERYASTLTTFAGANGFYSDQNRTDRNTYADMMVNIDKRIGDFSLNANIGASIKDLVYEQMGNEGDLAGIPNFFTVRNINYESNYKPKQFGYHDQSQGVFANIELGWRSMAYLTLTGRNDWESQLAFTKHSSFFYPSIGGSVVLSEMFRLPEFISYAKLRGSYSSVASSFERYLSNPGFEFNEQSHQWGSSTTLPATNLKPEDTRSWEIGLNARLWNHFSIDATYYHSNTYNQTFNITLASSSGYSSAIVQTGNIQNYGLELALGYNNTWGDFSWNSSLTYTMNRNKVKRLASGATNPITGEIIDMPELRMAVLGADGYGPRVILREGGTMGDLYVDKGLRTDGNGNIWVDSQTGKVGVQDYAEPKKIGTMNPDFNMGFSNTFSYKGINLGVVLTARVGGLCVSNTQGILDYYGVSKATADARDAGGVWINNGFVDAKSYYQTIGGSTGGLGQYYTYSATNIRLSELNLSYTLPRKWFNNKVGITAGIVGKNLWMIYCKAPFDPEMTPSTTSNFYQGVDYFMQPSTRNIGFNVKFQF